MALSSPRLQRWFGMGLFAVIAAMAGLAVAAPQPVENFTKLPAIDGVVISPSGTRLAMLLFGPEGRRRLAVMNLDPISELRVVAAFNNADVDSPRWVNDDRLVYQAGPREAEVAAGRAGTFTVNQDGSETRQLITFERSVRNTTAKAMAAKMLPYNWSISGAPDDGTDDVFVSEFIQDSIGDLKAVSLGRLNTRTSALRMLNAGMPEGTQRWLLDAKREPRLLSAYRDGRTKIYWRAASTDKWAEVADFDPLTESGFEPWFVDDNGEIFVMSRLHSDTNALYKFDPVAKRMDPTPVLKLPGFDLDAQPEVDSQTRRLVGVRFRTDRPTSYWFDAGLQSIQKGIDAALPGRNNRLYCGRCESTRFIVVGSSSDRQPVTYFLFDRTKTSLQSIGASRPWIDEATQGHRSFHVVQARDGLPIPVYVTHPAGAAADEALPAIVLVHGGPFLRGTDLSWHSEAQFLASRGYRVIEPEFRGSEGYGFRLFKAGWKQWGAAMQDDLADAVQWAAKQHLIDPTRVCVTGGSYGGYAALMAPIATPGVFRCAASFAGVTDINLMYSVIWSDTSEAQRRYGMPALIGDQVKDADRLAAASPLNRVAEIKIPLLVAHGWIDRRVPFEHAKQFIGAAKRAGVAVEQIDYPDEAHGFYKPANEADYYERLARFFEKSLASPR